MSEVSGSAKPTQRAPHLRWVHIKEMNVSPRAQREFRPAHAEKIAASFDLEALGYPVVNHRDGRFYIVDGQHRIAGLKLIGWADQQIQCECYEGLTEAEEADLFLRRDDRKAIRVFEKFRIAITAGREVETDIDRVVRANGLTVSNSDEGIKAVATLQKVYTKIGPAGLGRTLRIIRDAYGTPGLNAAVIEGTGLVCQRYNGQLDDDFAITRLARLQGGVNGLLNRAENIRRQTGSQRGASVAAAIVDVLNAGRGTKKLPGWWRGES